MIPNPFADNIVHEPRRIEKSVAGLNDGPLRQILGRFAELEAGEPPREDARLPTASFLTSAEAGYGKSHLIGRLFQELTRRATVVYVKPFVDSEGCWQSILQTTVKEMDMPEPVPGGTAGGNGPRQIEAFARGILTHLTTDLVAEGKVGSQDMRTAVGYLRRYANGGARTPEETAWESTWTPWMRANLDQLIPNMAASLTARGVRLESAQASSWLRVLGYLAYGAPDFNLTAGSFDWLCGRSIDEETAMALKIRLGDCPPSDGGISSRESLSRQRIMDLSRLAGFYRPFLFCFDQTENYGRSPVLGLSLAVLIQEMVDYCRNSLVLLTANQDSWKKRLLPHFEGGPYLARLSAPVSLEGITKDQAQEMVNQRLDAWPDDARLKPMRSGATLEKIYSGQTQMGIRTVLQSLREEWSQLTEPGVAPAKPVPEEIHAQYTREIELRPSRLFFDADFFKWLTRDVAACWPEVEVSTPDSDTDYFSVQWKKQGRTIRFGFEGGSHWKRWGSIEKASQAKAASGVISFFFRTPEHAPIPGPKWVSRDQVQAALKTHLRVATLTAKDIASMYACRSMYSDAVQGDLKLSPEEVLKFTAEKLKVWWERRFQETGEPQPALPMVPPPPPRPGLEESLRNIMRKAKFLSLEELETKLEPGWTKEEINKAIESLPELKSFPSPTMTVILWQAPVSR